MTRTTFEDLRAGNSFQLDSFSLTEGEIASFARQYDPQPFHTDPEAAADSMFGGIVASGWHTASCCMRLLVEHFLEDIDGGIGIGVEELRWPNPVRPDDAVAVSAEILEKERSSSRDDRGYLRVRVTGQTGDGRTVISWVSRILVQRSETTVK